MLRPLHKESLVRVDRPNGNPCSSVTMSCTIQPYALSRRVSERLLIGVYKNATNTKREKGTRGTVGIGTPLQHLGTWEYYFELYESYLLSELDSKFPVRRRQKD